jgi:hypothetical protein
MASTISAGTSAGTAIAIAGDTSGQLQLQTNNGTTAVTIDTAQKATFVNDASISGLTVGKGGGAVSSNTAFGVNALTANEAGGTNNTAIGNAALDSNTTGDANTALGQDALQANTTASNNTAVGYQAGYALTTGTDNVLIGISAGANLTTGSANLHLGGTSTASSASVLNEIVIGNSGAVGKGASTGYIYPNAGGVFQGDNSATWSITSDARLKKNIVDNDTGLGKIASIQVRNFEYRLPEEITEVAQDQAIKKTGVKLGAIAQEIQAVLPECVKQESTGIFTVDTDPLIWYLVNAVKELKAEIDQLKGN